MTVPALAFEALEIAFGARTILRDVTLDLQPGEVLGIAGGNGAGKTSLLRAASRVIAARSGRVRVRGRDIEDFSRRELAREVAVVPQDVQVTFPFRAGEVVLMGRSPHLGAFGYESKRDIELARAAMERVGVESLADRSMLELSGGERQLVLIARALAQDSGILLLDEPTAHLDLRHRISLQSLVRAFAGAGGSALVVSHDLTLAARSCDRIALVAGGTLLAAGPPVDIVTPENLRRAFGIEATVVPAPDGAPLVVPRV